MIGSKRISGGNVKMFFVEKVWTRFGLHWVIAEYIPLLIRNDLNMMGLWNLTMVEVNEFSLEVWKTLRFSWKVSKLSFDLLASPNVELLA